MAIRTATVDDVLKSAQQQRYVSKEEFLRTARDCLEEELQLAAVRFADSYKPGEKIDKNVAFANLRKAYMDMVGADGLPVSVSRLRFGLASAQF